MSIITVTNQSWAERWANRLKLVDNPEACDHAAKTDLTHGLGETRNHYCRTCGMHWYRGRTWTKAQWDEYVNDFSEDNNEYYFGNEKK